MPCHRLLLCALSATVQFAAGQVRTFDVYTDPILLHRGEVHNSYVQPKALPRKIVEEFANKTMHLRSMQLDIVRTDAVTGVEVALPLYETYNHHHALMVGPTALLQRVYNFTKGKDPLNPHQHPHGCAMMKGSSVRALLDEAAKALGPSGRRKISAFGGASGAEYRGTSTGLAVPYTYAVSNPESFMVLMHFINTRGVPHEKKLWECPCTSARKFNLQNGTIDGNKPLPFTCSEALQQEGNAACSLATYEGGYRCCEHGVFLTEQIPDPREAPDRIQAKFTFEYYVPDAQELAKGAVETTSPHCCDASSPSLEGDDVNKPQQHRFGNLEYDVPPCPSGTAPGDCVHTASSVEHFSWSPGQDPEEELELVHAWGHQHIAGLDLRLYKNSTGELLCHTRPRYGSGHVSGDERGFVVGIPPCVWGPPPLPPPPRLRRRDLMRTVARYNATEKHHGVMSLWLLTAAPLTKHAIVQDVLV